MSINRVTITGNLTRDALLRQTQSGNPVLTFAVAVNDAVREPDGSWGERANYVECALFGRRAQSLSDWLRRGTKVAIEGHLRWQSWERDGEQRSAISVIVDDLEFMGARRQG